MVFGACPAEFSAKILIRPVFGFVRFRVFVRRRGSRVPGRGAASAARQDKKSAVVAFLPYDHFPYGQLARPPSTKGCAHIPVVLDPRRERFRAFHGEDWILFGLPVGARQVAETDLKGRSTGRSGTSFVAADAQYGRGRPCDARGAYWGGRDGRLETFFPAVRFGARYLLIIVYEGEGTFVRTKVRRYI